MNDLMTNDKMMMMHEMHTYGRSESAVNNPSNASSILMKWATSINAYEKKPFPIFQSFFECEI
jgi:hypothetical protein